MLPSLCGSRSSPQSPQSFSGKTIEVLEVFICEQESARWNIVLHFYALRVVVYVLRCVVSSGVAFLCR